MIRFLSQVPFFSEVNESALEHLCQDLTTREVIAGGAIFKKGDQGDAMFVILAGEVRVHEQDHEFGRLSKGECFGEYALIDNQARSASVTAVKRTKILEIPRTHFLDLMQSDAGFAKGILAVMIRRHRDLDAIQEKLALSKQDIAQAHAQISGLVHGAMDAIIMFDSNFRIVLVNPAAESLLENTDALQRNVLFFLEEESAAILEQIVKGDQPDQLNSYLPHKIKVIGSVGTTSINEGTISKYGEDDSVFYTLILRNIEQRLKHEKTIDLLTLQADYLQQELSEVTQRSGMIAEDASMQAVMNSIGKVAQTDATVLITGETGTGKELVAQAIHASSQRSEKPMIRVNCGAIPPNLIESELFGHEKGAFTGATQSRKGRFHLADGGTLFLDEIGELPLDLQPKLLRVIQEGEFDPVGSSETIKADVRIIAATHRDLLELSKENKFREDLYYRLNVFPVEVPPLRERGGDLQLIAQAMLNRYTKQLGKSPIMLSDSEEALLDNHHWPGNVRELQNLMERAVITSDKGKVAWSQILPAAQGTASSQSSPGESSEPIYTSQQMQEREKENILRALRATHWKISGKNGAASLLKIPPTTLASRIKALGIIRPI